MEIKTIAILGDGGWGTTLAVYLAQKDWPVTVWGAFRENIEAIRKTGVNEKFLPGVKIPETVNLTSNLPAAINTADLIVLAIPSQYIAKTLLDLKQLSFKGKAVLSVIKGIDNESLLRMSQLISKELGSIDFAVLSGPTIAREVALGIPTTAVIASKNLNLAKNLQEIFNSDKFRIYTNNDVIGVELGGSLKNIIALACGVCDGLGFGTNAKAAIVTRGLVEMARLGHALGAQKKTFSGLTGLGDLVTTCFSAESRNRYVGEQLGKGKCIGEITAAMAMVAEGVATVKAVYKLAKREKVAMPITEEVYKIIYQEKPAAKAVQDLMNRGLKSE